MTDIASEFIKLSKLEKSFYEKYLHNEIAAKFREYLIECLTNFEGLDKQYVDKYCKTLEREIQKLQNQSSENLKLYNETKNEYSSLIEGDDESDLPEEIEKLSEATIEKIDKFEAKEDEFLRQQVLKNIIEQFEKKCKKQLEKMQNAENIAILNQILQIIQNSKKQNAENLEYLKQEVEKLDEEARKDMAELIDALDMHSKGKYKS